MNFKKILLIAVAVLMTATVSVGAKRQPALFNKVDKKAMVDSDGCKPTRRRCRDFSEKVCG